MRASRSLIALCARVCAFTLGEERHDSCKRPQNAPNFPPISSLPSSASTLAMLGNRKRGLAALVGASFLSFVKCAS